MNNKPETVTILFEVALLTLVVFLVDEWLIRGALAFIPAMLLAQRALDAGGPQASSALTSPLFQGGNHAIRGRVTKLLEYLRQFNATCHLAGSGEITPEEALLRTSNLEKDLSRLLADVTDGPQEVAKRPQVAQPLPTL